MLNLNPETICFIIAKAREFHAKEGVVFPEDSSGGSADDWAMQVLANHSSDLTYSELKLTIEDLEPDQQTCLVALMWLGREDYDIGEWESALDDARENITNRTSEYLISTPLVADYLLEGLDQLGYSCEE